MGSVLIVDDDQKLRDILSGIIRRNGMSTWTASNGAEALDRVRQHRPNVVLLDLKLPVMNGGDVLRELKAAGELERLAVIVFSSDDDPKVERATERLPKRGRRGDQRVHPLVIPQFRKV